ncbi:MAG: sulfite exporter TauE/SafE family protein [Clostridiales bacterium]|jgi:uncharacterized membrane protein YfcA|nr:sulfite exporter TauE/SafE family protein [Clostridiales bacterium]
MEIVRIIVLALAGLLGGVFGGMGMGGGTILIPLLTIFGGVPQHAAQAVNLVSFVPMAAGAIILHIRNKLIRFKGALYIIIPAALSSAGASLLAGLTEADVLKRAFGGFMILLALYSFWSEFFSQKARKAKLPAHDAPTV